MANMEKFSRSALGGVLGHYSRRKKENGEYIKFNNQQIDTTKTHLNYNLHQRENNQSDLEFIRQRTSELNALKRADVNVMCTWVITLPKGLVGASEDEIRLFFKTAYDFNAERYGKDNIIGAYVHMDETTPHMHFAFVPVTFDKEKQRYKVSSKEVFTRSELRNYHPDLTKAMTKAFGRDIGVQTYSKYANKNSKNKSRSIAELKGDNAYLMSVNDSLTVEKSKLEQEVLSLEQSRSELKKSNYKLKEELSNLNEERNNLNSEVQQLKADRLENWDLKKYLSKYKIGEKPMIDDFNNWRKKLLLQREQDEQIR